MSQQELADAIGVSQSTIGRWERGVQSPSAEQLQRIGEVLKTDPAWLLTGHGDGGSSDLEFVREPGPLARYQHGSAVSIPRFQTRPEAGTDAPSHQWVSGHVYLSFEDLAELRSEPQNLAAVRIGGDAMEPTFRSGDDLIIDIGDKQLRDGLWLLPLGGELSVRRVQVRPNGAVRILNDNPKYPPFDLDTEHASDLKIVGRVLRIRMREP